MEPESEPVKKIPGAVAGQKRTGSTTLQDPNLVSGCKLLELGRSVSTLQWANGITETCINLHVRYLLLHEVENPAGSGDHQVNLLVDPHYVILQIRAA